MPQRPNYYAVNFWEKKTLESINDKAKKKAIVRQKNKNDYRLVSTYMSLNAFLFPIR